MAMKRISHIFILLIFLSLSGCMTKIYLGKEKEPEKVLSDDMVMSSRAINPTTVPAGGTWGTVRGVINTNFTNINGTLDSVEVTLAEYGDSITNYYSDIQLRLLKSDTASMLANYTRNGELNTALTAKVSVSDTAAMLANYALTSELGEAGIGISDVRDEIADSLNVLRPLYVAVSDTAGMLDTYAKLSDLSEGGISIGAVRDEIADSLNVLRPATLVGDATEGPFFDGSADGGQTLTFYGDNGFWTALQGGAPVANRSYRLPIAALPGAGTTSLMNIDEYGNMGFAFNGIPATLTATELGYVDGVTSSIQNQLNAKVNASDTAAMLAHYALLSEIGTGGDISILETRVDSIVDVLADSVNIEALLQIDFDSDTLAKLSDVRSLAGSGVVGVTLNGGTLTLTGDLATADDVTFYTNGDGQYDLPAGGGNLTIMSQVQAWISDTADVLRAEMGSAPTSSTYYVSNTGSDAADGLTPETAWQTISKVNDATLTPGTAVYFNRGDEWREQLTIDQSGTSSSRLTFSAYGTGAKPIINGADVTTGWGDSYNNIDPDIWGTVSPNVITTRCMVLIDDSLYTQVATLAELVTPRTYWINSTSTPDSLYVWSKTDPDSRTAEVSHREYGIVSTTESYITLSNLDVRMAGRMGILFYNGGVSLDAYIIIDSVNAQYNRLVGIGLYEGINESVIQNCTASWNGNNFIIWGTQGTGPGTGGVGANNNIIRNCYSSYSIHDYIMAGQYSDGTGYQIFNSDNCIIENNISDHDQQGIYLDPYTNGGLTLTARYNKIYEANAISSSYGIGVSSSAATSVTNIYYNLVVNCGNATGDYPAIHLSSTHGGLVNFYNNTVYNDGVATIANQVRATNGTNITLLNNIFYFTETVDDYYVNVWVTSTGEPTSDYNQFYKNVVWGYVYFNGTPYATLANWQTASSQDDNSQSGNPLFITTGTDFRLRSNSPSIDNGTLISAIPQFDILGNPVVGTPDMGCYENQYDPEIQLLTDVLPIFVFGAGGGMPTDTATFQNGVIAGAFYNSGSDNLKITSLRGVLAEGTGTETIGVQVSWHATFKSASAVNLNASPLTITSITTGDEDTSFAYDEIPPGVWVWCTLSGASANNKPTLLSLTMSGYKIPTY